MHAIEISKIVSQLVAGCQLSRRSDPGGVDDATALHFQREGNWQRELVCKVVRQHLQKLHLRESLGVDFEIALSLAIEQVDFCLWLVGTASMGL